MNKDGRLPLIAPAEAAAKIREGALAADIRSRAEYRGGHIGGALSLPPEQHRGKLPDNAAPCLIFYCLGGKRTAMAEAVLAELGRGRECYILEGGLQAWKAAGRRSRPRRARYHAAGANHCRRADSVRRTGGLAGVAVVLPDKRGSRRRPADGRADRILRHGAAVGQHAVEPLNGRGGRLKVADGAVIADNAAPPPFAEKPI